VRRWAVGVSAIVADGGRLVLIDFHPMALMFDEHFQLTWPYFGNGQPYKCDAGVSDYVGRSGAALAPSGFEEGMRDFANPHATYEFQWHLSAILTAVLDAGLRVDQFREYPFLNGVKLYEQMRELPGRRMYLPENMPSVPLMFGLVASKAEVGGCPSFRSPKPPPPTDAGTPRDTGERNVNRREEHSRVGKESHGQPRG
jgi:hypothetical protein